MPLPDPPEGASPDIAPVRYRTRHITRYEYGDGVSVSQHIVHLLPREIARQHCAAAQLTITPESAVRSDWIDFFGNPVTYIAVQEPHRVLEITSEIELEVKPPPAFDPAATPAWETLRKDLQIPAGAGAIEASQFAFDSLLVGAS